MTANDDSENLRDIPLLAVFEPNALGLLTLQAQTRLLGTGDALYRRGETSDGGFILMAGSIVLETHDDGRSPAKILIPRTLLGEVSLIVETTHTITAIAREPSSVLKIPRRLFRHVLDRHPSTAAQVQQVFKSRFGELRQLLKFDPLP